MNLAEKALSRVIWQYQQSINLLAWIQILPTIAQTEVEDPLELLINILDIDSQSGELLDLVGRIIGQSRYANGSSLTDSYYRILLKAKLRKNISDATIDSIRAAAEYIAGVPVTLVEDNQDMTFQIVFGGTLSGIVRTMLTDYDLIPRPQGVKFIGFTETSGGLVFGFSEPTITTPAHIGGWNELGDTDGGEFAELYGA